MNPRRWLRPTVILLVVGAVHIPTAITLVVVEAALLMLAWTVAVWFVRQPARRRRAVVKIVRASCR